MRKLSKKVSKIENSIESYMCHACPCSCGCTCAGCGFLNLNSAAREDGRVHARNRADGISVTHGSMNIG